MIFTSSYDRAWGVGIQPDGKIIAVGSSNTQSATRNDTGIVRLNLDGSLDTTFSGDGKLKRQFGSNHSDFYDVLVQPDGKILICGQTYVLSGSQQPRSSIARISASGAFETLVSANYASGTLYETFRDMEFDENGKIVIAGSASVSNGVNRMTVTRMNANLTFDNTFSDDGRLSFHIIGSLDATAYSVGLHNYGGTAANEIVLGGQTKTGAGDNDYAVAVLTPNGGFYTPFSGDGKGQCWYV